MGRGCSYPSHGDFLRVGEADSRRVESIVAWSGGTVDQDVMSARGTVDWSRPVASATKRSAESRLSATGPGHRGRSGAAQAKPFIGILIRLNPRNLWSNGSQEVGACCLSTEHPKPNCLVGGTVIFPNVFSASTSPCRNGLPLAGVSSERKLGGRVGAESLFRRTPSHRRSSRNWKALGRPQRSGGR